MIEKLVTSFVGYQAKVGTMREEDVDVYQYGYTLMIELFLNIIFSFVLGILLGEVKEVFFFLCMFIPLRSFCGGYHAAKIWQCFIFSNLAVLVTIVFSKWMAGLDFVIAACAFIEIVIIGLIWYLSPVDSDNKRMSFSEKKKMKIIATAIIIIEVLVGDVVLYLGVKNMFCLLFLVHIIQIISLVIVPEKKKDQ